MLLNDGKIRYPVPLHQIELWGRWLVSLLGLPALRAHVVHATKRALPGALWLGEEAGVAGASALPGRPGGWWPAACPGASCASLLHQQSCGGGDGVVPPAATQLRGHGVRYAARFLGRACVRVGAFRGACQR